MKTKEGKSISTPDILGVALNSQGANVEPDGYPVLLRKAARRLDINPTYFENPHDYSTIHKAARYVRVREEKSRKIHAQNGVLKRISELIADADYRKFVADDTKVNGYYHTLTFSSEGAQRLLEHRYSKEIKHYHPKHPDSVDEDSPLQHPKLEVSLKTKRNDTGGVSWHRRDRLKQELDEQVLNVLGWEGLPLHDDGYTYISDGYHEVDESDRNLHLIEDPTPQIRNEQDAIVAQKLRGINDSDVSVIEEVVEKGRAKPDEVADETGYHISTIYRAVNRLEGLLEKKKDGIEVTSRYLAERLNDAVQEAEETLKQTAETAARMLDMSEKEMERRGSALLDWMQAYGGEVKDPENDLPYVKIDRLNGAEPKKVVRKLIRAWEAVGRSTRRLKMGTVKYEHPQLNKTVIADISAVAERRGTKSSKSGYR
jgi:predicted transcriptional regulator